MLTITTEDAEREEGFSLIELSVVVLIIGILAAIAVPSFLSQRARAWEEELASGVRNVALEIESAAVGQGGDYRSLTGGTEILGTGLQATADALLGQTPLTFTRGDVTSTGFCIHAAHARLTAASADATVRYATASGGLSDVGKSCPMPQRPTRLGRVRR